jgi:hypothetical protein
MGDAGNSVTSRVWKGAHIAEKGQRAGAPLTFFLFRKTPRFRHPHPDAYRHFLVVRGEQSPPFQQNLFLFAADEKQETGDSHGLSAVRVGWRMHVPLRLADGASVDMSRFHRPFTHSRRHDRASGRYPLTEAKMLSACCRRQPA